MNNNNQKMIGKFKKNINLIKCIRNIDKKRINADIIPGYNFPKLSLI